MKKEISLYIIKMSQLVLNRLFPILVILILVSITSCDAQSQKDKKRKAKVKTMTEQKNDGSAEYYDYEAKRRLDQVIKEMSQEVSPYDLIIKLINRTEEYCWKALDVDSTYTPGWEKLGYLYSQVHGKQSLLRYNSARNRGETEKMKNEENVIALNFTKANLYYDKALEFGTEDSAGIYFQKAAAADMQGHMSLSVANMMKAVETEPDNRKYETKLIESFMYAGMFDKALNQNEIYRKKYPESDIPYINLGGYYYFNGDTIKAIENYKIAIEKGTKPEVAILLNKYYSSHNDTATANFYLGKLEEIKANYNPEDY